MKRAFLIFLMLFVSVVSLSFATVTRVKTMGNVGDFVYDDSNIFRWPSTVVGFTDRFLLELGEDNVANATYDPAVGPAFPNGFGGGALYGLNDQNHLGFFVTGNDRSNGGGISDPFFPGNLTLDDFLTLFYGYGAEKVDAGVSFNVAKSRNEQTAPDANKFKQSVGRVGIQGGITYWLEDDNSLDVGFEYDKTSLTDEDANGTNAKDDGFHTVAVRARLFHNYTDNVQFVPFVEYMQANRGRQWDNDNNDNTALVTDKSETRTVDLAMGVNHFPHENLQLIFVGGIRLMHTKLTDQGQDAGETNSKHIPYIKGGVDSELRNWLDLRAGVEKQFSSDNQKGAGDNAAQTEQSSADYQGYIGAGIHLGDWTIDTQVNPRIFFDGPNFISGTTESLNTRVSLVRPW